MIQRAQASKLAYLPVTSFVQRVASRDATPGGGTVAALSGSLGASLLAMVCRLTQGKRKHAAVEPAMREREAVLLPLRDRLRDLVDEDAAAFDTVMDAYGLPADAPERAAAIADAYARATRVPLEAMRLCLAALEHGEAIARDGAEGALSDAAVGALTLLTGLTGAAYNVRINLKELRDEALRAEAGQALSDLPARGEALAAAVRRAVDARLAG
jgi:formiminotetrahydrofolate cyclodeaminase